MTLTLWQRLDKTGRNLAPFAVTVMLALIGLVPVPAPGYAPVAPFLTAIAIYYWAIHRPDLMRPGTAFLIGLLQDLLTGGPLGVNALVLVHVVASVSGFFGGMLAMRLDEMEPGPAAVAMARRSLAAVLVSGVALLLVPFAQ